MKGLNKGWSSSLNLLIYLNKTGAGPRCREVPGGRRASGERGVKGGPSGSRTSLSPSSSSKASQDSRRLMDTRELLAQGKKKRYGEWGA